jgi:hypothetical protein
MMRMSFQLRFAAMMAFLALSPISRSAPPIPPELASSLHEGSVKSVNGRTELSANTSRPFALAIGMMRIQYGVAICYEDPPYKYPDDVSEATPKGIRKYRMPAYGQLSLTYSSNDVLTVLKQLAQVRLEPDRGAHFQVTQAGSVFMFTPVDARDANGNRGSSESPLDARITMPNKSRPASETLSTVLALAATASKQRIVYMTPPGPDHPGDPTYEVEARDETARSVLLRVLALMAPQKGPFAWDLMFDPDSNQYYMNFAAVINVQRSAVPPTESHSAPDSAGHNAADSGISPH